MEEDDHLRLRGVLVCSDHVDHQRDLRGSGTTETKRSAPSLLLQHEKWMSEVSSAPFSPPFSPRCSLLTRSRKVFIFSQSRESAETTVISWEQSEAQ